MKDAPDFLTPSSKEAIHAAKNAAQAVELAREEQLVSAMRFNDERTVKLFVDAIHSVFGPVNADQDQMRILIPKIPLLCLTVQNQGKMMTEIKDDLKWATRLILGAVILAALGVILVK